MAYPLFIILTEKIIKQSVDFRKGSDAVIARLGSNRGNKGEYAWDIGTPNEKQKQAFLAKTLYVGYGGA